MKLLFRYLSYFLAWISLIFIVVFEWLYGIFTLILIVMAACVIAGIFSICNSKKPFKTHFFSSIIGIGVFLWTLILILFSWIFYENTISPLVLSNITLENSKWQKVVFVKMSHIAQSDFFSAKKASIEWLAKKNFMILAEGVKPWEQASMETLEGHLNIQDFQNIYASVARIIGLQEQNNDFLYQNIDKKNLIFPDISIDQVAKLLWEYRDPIIGKNNPISPRDFDQINNSLSIPQKWLLQQVMMAVFSSVQKIVLNSHYDVYSDKKTQKLMQVILHERNKPVAEYILKNPDKNIAVVYGALHFEGVFDILKQSDSSWSIVSLEPFFPYRQ